MIMSIYNAKGGVGKTPIATNIALDKGYCIGTNEVFNVYEHFMKDDELMTIGLNEEFPGEIKDNDINIIFDLAGAISDTAKSITSAIMMSDMVIVPMNNEFKSLVAGVNSINQIMQYNQNILVVATKLQKAKQDRFINNWKESEDFKNIETVVHEKISKDITVLPLKLSKVFDNIFDDYKSIEQIMQSNALAKYSYQEVGKQFQEVYKYLKI